jgi:hypothetical protein
MTRALSRRYLEFEFPHSGVTASVELLDAYAPKTCTAMWQAFAKPSRRVLKHAKYVGAEVAFEIPPESQTFDPTSVPVFPLGSGENLTWTPNPGDVLWCYFPAFYFHGRPSAMWDLVIIYGRDAKVLVEAGVVPLNHWGLIVEGLEAFAATCRLALVEGPREMVIRRAE